MNESEKGSISKRTPRLQMTEMEQVQILTNLSQQMMTQYHERRNLEWRIHVLLWTLLVAGAYFIVTVGINVKSWVWVVLLLLVFVVHIIWTLKMQLGEIRDQDQSVRYRKAAEALVVSGQAILPSEHESGNEQSALPQWLQKRLQGYWLWNVVIFGTTAVMEIAIAAVAITGSSGEPASLTKRLVDIEHKMEILQQDRRVTALELKHVRDDIDVLRQKSSGSFKAQASRQQR